MEQFRDNIGIINLNEITSLDYEEVNTQVYRFNYAGKKYYFKSSDIKKTIGILFACAIAEEFDIPHVDYDIAFYEFLGMGALSESYLKKGESRMTLEKLLEEVYGDKITTPHCIFSDIKEAFIRKYQDIEVADTLMDEFIDIYTLDIILGNHDRHDRNIEIIEGPNGIHLAPAFDFEMLFEDYATLDHDYFIKVESREEDDDVKAFLQTLSKPYTDRLISGLDIIKGDNASNLWGKVERKMKVSNSISDGLKDSINRRMNLNYRGIEREVNKYKSNQLVKA